MSQYTMLELAQLLGTSKEVIKYHRKHLPDTAVGRNDRGQVVIFEEGVTIIRGKLRKEDYSTNFKQQTLRQLEALRTEFDPSGTLFRSLRAIENVLGIDSSVTVVSHDTFAAGKNPVTTDETEPVLSLPEQIKQTMNDSFIAWYCQKHELDQWADWRWEFVSLIDFLTYLEQSPHF